MNMIFFSVFMNSRDLFLQGIEQTKINKQKTPLLTNKASYFTEKGLF